MLIDVFSGATRVGYITTAQPGAKMTTPLDKVGSFSFACSASDPDAGSLIEGRTVYGYEKGKVRLSGIIGQIGEAVSGEGVPLKAVSGMAIAQELVQARSGEVALSEAGYATSVGVFALAVDWVTGGPLGDPTDMPNAYDKNDATAAVFAGGGATDWVNYYIGGVLPFTKIYLKCGRVGAASGGITGQYLNSHGWTDIAVTSDGTMVDGVSWGQNGVVEFTLPDGPMLQSTEQGVSAYFIRIRPGISFEEVRWYEAQTWGLVATATALALVAATFPTTANGYAGTWTLDTVNGLAATVKTDVYDTIYKGNVFQALTKLAELTGEHFYCTADRKVVWIGNTNAVSVGPDIGGTGILDLQVSASGDDGFSETTGDAYNNNAASIQLGKGGNDTQQYKAWMRFLNVAIPQGATITAAYMQWHCELAETDNPSVRIFANDVDNAVAPTTAAERQALVNTTAYADYTLEDYAADTWYTTPSLVPVVQEIVDQPGWTENNAMQLLVDNNGSGVLVYRFISTYDRTGNVKGPKLHVEYSTVVAGETLHIISPPVPSLVEDNGAIALLTSLTITTDGHERATRVYPHGAGLGEGSLDLTYVTDAWVAAIPAGYVISRAGNYICIDPEGTRVDAEPDFKDIGPKTSDLRARENAADALASASLVWLGRHGAAIVTYAVGCVNLDADAVKPGNKVWVEYWEYVAGQLVASVDDANLIVLSTTESFGDGAAVASDLTVSTLAQWPVTDTEFQARMYRNQRAMGATPQALGIADLRTADFTVDPRPFGSGAGGLARTTSSPASGGGGGGGMSPHVLTSAWHTETGLTAGDVLTATGATAFGFAAPAATHAAITLAANADTVLSLSTQEIGLDTQIANLVWAGPTTGAAADPTFRALVTADLPVGTVREPLTDGAGNLIFAAGDVVMI